MNKMQDQVMDFMVKAGQDLPSIACMIDDKIARLRVDLIDEENGELESATNLVEVADAIGDLLYVVFGAAAAYGLDIEPIFEEIHRSNMTKFIDGHKATNGKWIKGPSYEPANLAPIVEAQTKPPQT